MIRKCVAIMMTVVLMFSMLMVMPVKAETTAELWVNGVDLLADADKSISCGNGSATFDDATKTLTLSNAQISIAHEIEDEYFEEIFQYGVYLTGFNQQIKIVLEGNNTIHYDAYGDESTGIFSTEDIHITGTGNLTIFGEDLTCGIYSKNNITLESTTVKMEGAPYSDAIVFYAKNSLTVDSSIVKADKVYRGIQGEKLIIKNKSELNIVAYANCAAINGTITVDDSKFVGETKENEYNTFRATNSISITNNSDMMVTGYYPPLYSATITIDASKVNAKSHDDAAIYTTSKLTITNAEITAVGRSSGIACKSNMKIVKSVVDAKGNKGLKSNVEVYIEESVVNAEGTEYAIYVSKTSTQKSLTKEPTAKSKDLICVTGASYDPEGSVLSETGWKVVEIYDADLEETVKRWKAESYLVTPTGAVVKNVNIKIKDADYTKLNELVDQVNALNKDDYINYYEIENAMSKIVYGLNANSQLQVDTMVYDLQMAINLLEKKPDPKVEKVKFVKNKIKLKVGKSATLKVKLTPAKLGKAEKKVKWSIDKKGKKVVKFVKKANKLTGKLSAKVKALKKGKAKVTCKAPSGKKVVCTVTVK